MIPPSSSDPFTAGAPAETTPPTTGAPPEAAAASAPPAAKASTPAVASPASAESTYTRAEILDAAGSYGVSRYQLAGALHLLGRRDLRKPELRPSPARPGRRGQPGKPAGVKRVGPAGRVTRSEVEAALKRLEAGEEI